MSMDYEQELLAKIDSLQATVDRMAQTIAEQAETIAEQAATIAKLLEQKNKNSNNSSKPPSSDGLGKKPRSRSLKESSGKKAGGQEGHNGASFIVTDNPDHIEKHLPLRCACCPNREACAAAAKVIETRYVVDCTVQTKTTAHDCCEVVCPLTGTQEIGVFPKDVSAHMQYGNNLQSLVVALNTVGAVSINRVHQIIGNIFGIPLSTGTVSNIVRRFAEAISSQYAQIGDAVAKADIAHFDETGTRVAGKTVWVHTASTSDATFLYLGLARGSKGMETGNILPRFHGTAVHDCWMPYWKYDCTHAVCCAHLLRELNGVMENHPDQSWAEQFKGLLLNMKKAKELRLAANDNKLPEEDLEKYITDYDNILKVGKAENPVELPPSGKHGRPKKGKVRALIERLEKFKGEVCRFITDLSVPFDNNLAERDIRNMKVKAKVSGCFRTEEGARDYLMIMSYIGTAIKQGLNPYRVVIDAMEGLPSGLSLNLAAAY